MSDSSPYSSLQLTVLCDSLLPLPGCLSRVHRHAELFFGLGVARPSPPQQPALLRRRNPIFRRQYGCYKGGLHINTVAAGGYRPEVVSDHCRPAQMGLIRQSSPVDSRRTLYPFLPQRSAASEATLQFYSFCQDVVVRDG